MRRFETLFARNDGDGDGVGDGDDDANHSYFLLVSRESKRFYYAGACSCVRLSCRVSPFVRLYPLILFFQPSFIRPHISTHPSVPLVVRRSIEHQSVHPSFEYQSVCQSVRLFIRRTSVRPFIRKPGVVHT